MVTNKLIGGLAGLAMVILLAGTVHAALIEPTSVTFNEVFLETADDINYLSMVEKDLVGSYYFDTGNKAKFWFDLTDVGGVGRLINTSGVGERRVQTIAPSTDEAGYDPLFFDAPYMAYVDFYFSDFIFDDPANSPEKIRIDLGTHNGLTAIDFVLEDDPDGQKMIRIDLVNLDLLDELIDGQLLATVVAPAFGLVDNTFILDRVELTAEAMPIASPVPIPSAALLLGAGLVGLVGIRTRHQSTS